MSKPAVIKAVFADYRRIKSRKVMQLVFEVPLETWPADYKVLGEPEIETSQWFAIAKMAGMAEPAPTPDEIGSKLVANAAMMIQEPSFHQFLRERHNVVVRNNMDADHAIKALLGIASKREIGIDPAASEKWRDLRASYEAWKLT
jgi:hypothetical protein